MKTTCEGCRQPLPPNVEAYVCSYECTFCPKCSSHTQHVCPHCGGELLRRPRRYNDLIEQNVEPESLPLSRAGIVWASTFAVWIFIALAATATIYALYRSTPDRFSLREVAGMQFSQFMTYAVLTPFVLWFAVRYPLQRDNWGRRAILHLLAGLAFALAHISLRALTPYAYWDPAYREWTSAIWDVHAHVFRAPWTTLKNMFLGSVVDDIASTYVPIVLVAHALSYYKGFRQRELRNAQLASQLAKSRLQTLKSQLQPHFLFNTLHSISALMLTDVHAADRMMSRLSDLLRVSLESAGTQITTLHRELEFVNCYLDIEKIRFEERLSVILDIAPETLDAQVPHLLLQPLVDNAVKHGISKLPAGGEIRIAASVHGTDLHLEVGDNGLGFATPATGFTNGLGMRVTRERLQSLYGDQQSLQVLSPPEGGVTVLVSIPFRPQPAGEAAETELAHSRQG